MGRTHSASKIIRTFACTWAARRPHSALCFPPILYDVCMRRGTSDTFHAHIARVAAPSAETPTAAPLAGSDSADSVVGLVLYPNPRPLVVSLERLFRPPLIRMLQRGALADRLPNDAEAEAFSRRSVPYRTAWDLYGQFWYFPTVTETLAAGGGDCQAEAILTASILQAKGLPTRFATPSIMSADHRAGMGWESEDPATTIAPNSGAGWWSGLPSASLRDIVRERLQYPRWEPMPAVRGHAVLGAARRPRAGRVATAAPHRQMGNPCGRPPAPKHRET